MPLYLLAGKSIVNGRKTFEKWHGQRVCEHQKSQSDMRGGDSQRGGVLSL